MATSKTAKAETPSAEPIRADSAIIGGFAQEAVHADRRILKAGKGTAEKVFVLVRDGSGNESLKEIDGRGPHMAVAERIVQRVTLETTDSLIAYVNRFKANAGDDAVTIFASIKGDSFAAVMDYHTPEAAGFGEHVASLKLQRSEEWKAWAERDGKMMDQLSFVRFLDENRADIVSPDTATLLELCRDLQGLRKADFRSVVRADSNNFKVEYAESAEVKRNTGELLMPTEFLLRLPVYFGGESHDLYALLIWQVVEGEGLKLGYKLRRPEKLRQAVFLSNVASIAASTSVEVVHGSRANIGSSDF